MKTFYQLTCSFAFVLFFSAAPARAQSVQTIKGIVRDKNTKQPLPGAIVKVANLDNAIGTISGEDGAFRLTSVPTGRRSVECAFLGYEPFVSEEFILNPAKEPDIQIELAQAVLLQSQVIVSAVKNRSAPLNELSIVSARSFSPEETNRYAATANDVGRMAMGFPGVQISNDDSNGDIIIRGNSGIGLLWQVEGVEIPNPNHFARRGSSGGGISIFSSSVLGTSDFSSGAFPAEYGNALAGVFDIKFRKGNSEKRENTIKVGLVGLEYATEGPVGAKGGSYLVNYRYSTLGILNKLGLQLAGPRIDDNFQDISFNVYLPTADPNHSFGIWGIGGLSTEKRRMAQSPMNYDDLTSNIFTTNIGAIGANHSWLINKRSFVKTSLALMGQTVVFDEDYNPPAVPARRINSENYQEGRLTLASFYSYTFNPKATLKTGVSVSDLFYNFESYAGRSIADSVNVFNKYGTYGRANTFGATPSAFLIQPYSELRYRPDDRWNFNFGLHAIVFTINNTFSLEPRFGVQYKYAPNQSFSFGYGLNGKIQPLGTYYTVFGGYFNDKNYANRNLEIIKSHHFVLAHEIVLNEKYKLHSELYYQYLFNIPVGADPNSTYSALNVVEDFPNRALSGKGTGQNYGIDVSLERLFDRGAFFIASGSLFNSVYQPLNGLTYSSQYNTHYSLTFMGGKEWRTQKNSVWQFGLKMYFIGGTPATPLAAVQNGDVQNPALDEAHPNSLTTPAYIRPDLKISYRKDNLKTAYTIALDVQNFISHTNVNGLSRNYDPATNTWVYKEQAGLIPVISFQMDF